MVRSYASRRPTLAVDMSFFFSKNIRRGPDRAVSRLPMLRMRP
jgi:hypothetical protein